MKRVETQRIAVFMGVGALAFLSLLAVWFRSEGGEGRIVAGKGLEKINPDMLCDYQRELATVESHYGPDYYAWQKNLSIGNSDTQSVQIRNVMVATFGAENVDKLTVLEIGCSFGMTLARVPGQKKYCLEINPSASADHAKEHPWMISLNRWQDLPLKEVDFAYSFDSFEHHPSPLDSTICTRRRLKDGGYFFLQVPFEHSSMGNSEAPKMRYAANDKHQHIFTWAPNNLGNLMGVAGFKILDCTDLNDEKYTVSGQKQKSPVHCLGQAEQAK